MDGGTSAAAVLWESLCQDGVRMIWKAGVSLGSKRWFRPKASVKRGRSKDDDLVYVKSCSMLQS